MINQNREMQLLEFVSDNSHLSKSELRNKLKSEGVNVESFLARISAGRSGRRSKSQSSTQSENILAGLKTIESQNNEILERLRKQGEHGHSMVWRFVHQMTHFTRDVIPLAANPQFNPSTKEVVGTLVSFCDAIITLLSESWDGQGVERTFRASVRALVAHKEFVTIAADQATSEESKSECDERFEAAAHSSLMDHILSPQNMFTSDNRVIVGIRKSRAGNKDLFDLIGFLSVVCCPMQKGEVIFSDKHPLETGLRDMLLSYADISFIILSRGQSGRAVSSGTRAQLGKNARDFAFVEELQEIFEQRAWNDPSGFESQRLFNE